MMSTPASLDGYSSAGTELYRAAGSSLAIPGGVGSHLPSSPRLVDIAASAPRYEWVHHSGATELDVRVAAAEADSRFAMEEIIEPIRLLRIGFAALPLLLTAGLLLTSFAMATDAGSLVRGIGVTAMWAGQATAAVAAHVYGRRTGFLLFGKLSKFVMTFAVGMTIVAAVATIEFSIW